MISVIYAEEQWMNSQLSLARMYGVITLNDTAYYVVNKEGETLLDISDEMNRNNRDGLAIPAGEPADLIDENFIPYYKAVGRGEFFKIATKGGSKEHIKSECFKTLVDKYNTKDFIDNDPVQFPYRHIGQDQRNIEISGFLTSLVSFGRRNEIIKKSTDINDMFKGTPYMWLKNRSYERWFMDGHFYRTLSYKDFHKACSRLASIYEEHKTLEDAVVDKMASNLTPYQALSSLFEGTAVPDWRKGSPCKRLNMFLRWMVRNDNIVDLGIWHKISPSELFIPVDTHVHKQALELGLTSRKTADAKTMTEITEYFKTIFPDDPAKGDFALFGLGVNNK